MYIFVGFSFLTWLPQRKERLFPCNTNLQLATLEAMEKGIDKALLKSFHNAREEIIPITEPILLEQAHELA
ncbi:hypothetical protein KUTeg_015630 [Tegillarca granosa]|uniref:Uncharacterized protein n=1 Tax=Tegillarca granosa TaxID=220873 RepID=A0ABQ9ET48_TEGGR|nr:hypothetical protein KUTeg_015630 [Tegillarca granosa]